MNNEKYPSINSTGYPSEFYKKETFREDREISYTDKLLLREIAKTKDPAQAALNIFPELNDKRKAGYFMRGKLKSYAFKHRLSELLDKQGLHIYRANQKLDELLEAKKPVITKDGMEYVSDNSVQDAALEKLYKLHGHLSNKDIPSQVTQVQVNINQEDSTHLAKVIEDLQSLYGQIKDEKVIDIKSVP